MLRYNGGYSPKTKFKAGKLSSDIRVFYGLGQVPCSFDTLDIDSWIKRKLLPIACDSFGNYIAIGVSSEENGKIFFVDHELSNKLTCVSDDFISFIKCCKSDKIPESAKRTIKEREDALIARGKGAIITDDLRRLWQAEIDKYTDMVQEKVEL